MLALLQGLVGLHLGQVLAAIAGHHTRLWPPPCSAPVQLDTQNNNYSDYSQPNKLAEHASLRSFEQAASASPQMHKSGRVRDERSSREERVPLTLASSPSNQAPGAWTVRIGRMRLAVRDTQWLRARLSATPWPSTHNRVEDVPIFSPKVSRSV